MTRLYAVHVRYRFPEQDARLSFTKYVKASSMTGAISSALRDTRHDPLVRGGELHSAEAFERAKVQEGDE